MALLGGCVAARAFFVESSEMDTPEHRPEEKATDG